MILAATMIFLTLGCEKRIGQAEDADRFDEKIDGPTCVLTVSADENLLADQKKISRQTRTDAETPAETEEKTDDVDSDSEETYTPVAKPAVKPVAKPAVKPAAKPVAKPVVKPSVVPGLRSDEERRRSGEREM